MLQLINDLPANVVAIRAVGNITKEDYENVLIPAVERVDQQFKEINFLMVIETSIADFRWGAWMNDAKISIQKYTKWNKVAIVTDEKIAQYLSYALGIISPAEAKSFSIAELEQAKQWVSATTVDRK